MSDTSKDYVKLELTEVDVAILKSLLREELSIQLFKIIDTSESSYNKREMSVAMFDSFRNIDDYLNNLQIKMDEIRKDNPNVGVTNVVFVHQAIAKMFLTLCTYTANEAMPKEISSFFAECGQDLLNKISVALGSAFATPILQAKNTASAGESEKNTDLAFNIWGQTAQA